MDKDLISRSALLAAFGEEPFVWDDLDRAEIQERNDWIAYTELVKAAPAVDAVVVYRIYDDCLFPGDCYTKRKCDGCEYRNLFIEEQRFCLSMLSGYGAFGHPYYRTREEAEAAIKRRGEHEQD